MNDMNEMNNMQGVQPVQYNMAVNPVKVKKEYTKKEAIFAAVSVILGFLVIKLVLAPASYGDGFGLGAAAALLLLTVYACLWTKQKSRSHIVRMFLCFVFSANVFISSNTFIQFLDVVFVGLILVYDRFAVSDGIEKIRKLFPTDLLSSVFARPFSCFGDAFEAVSSQTSGTKAARGIGNILIGAVIAVPSTFIVAVLLSRADSGFENIMNSLFDDFLSNAFCFILQLIFGIPIGFYIFGSCYSSAHHEIKAEDSQDKLAVLRIVPAMAGVFSAVPVCVLYVIFFFSQLNHYISAFMNKLPDDEIYSSYARDGFFELCAVAVINLLILVFLNVFCRHGDNGRTKPVKAMSFVICIFTLMLIATAVSKMVLYIDAYGLTLLRTYTTWFMALLTVVFLAVAAEVFSEKVNISRVVVAVFTVMFAALSFCNVDGIIAEYNISRYESGTLSSLKADDFRYLSSGSYPAMNRAYQNGDFHSSEGAEAEVMLSEKHTSDDVRTITFMDIYADRVCGK